MSRTKSTMTKHIHWIIQIHTNLEPTNMFLPIDSIFIQLTHNLNSIAPLYTMENQITKLTSAITNHLNLPSPTMQLPHQSLRNNGALWNNAIIMTLLHGDNLNPNLVMRSVKTKWSVRESADVIRAGPNRFVCRFQKSEDLERVLYKQPWQVLGHLIILEPFSTGNDAQSIRFETIPLWISFIGLELEHYSTEIVRMIASAAGSVIEVLPVGVIPRSAEGYRAHVNVLVHFPLVEGTMVNTLHKGDVWVSFKYNGLPPLFCSTCRRLGHARNNCNSPRVNAQVHEPLLIGFHENFSLDMNDQRTTAQDQSAAMEDINVWPHEINFPADATINLGQASNAAENLGPNLTMGQASCEVPDESQEAKCKSLVQLWIESGLLSQDELQSMGISVSPTTKTGNNEAQIPTPFNPNAGLFNPGVENPNPSFQNVDLQPANINVPLVINEPSIHAPAARRRGRPPGATNRIPKPTKADKGKAPMFPENTDESNKKRKTMETSSQVNDYGSYAPDPSITEVPINSSTNPNPSPFSLDFIRQLMLHPDSASLLLNDGIINPALISLINNQSPSPASIFNGPYAADSDDEISDNENFNNNEITVIEIGTPTDLITHDPSGAYEIRTGTVLNMDANAEADSINPPTGQLLYSSTGETHNEEVIVLTQVQPQKQNAKDSFMQSKEESPSN